MTQQQLQLEAYKLKNEIENKSFEDLMGFSYKDINPEVQMEYFKSEGWLR